MSTFEYKLNGHDVVISAKVEGKYYPESFNGPEEFADVSILDVQYMGNSLPEQFWPLFERELYNFECAVGRGDLIPLEAEV